MRRTSWIEFNATSWCDEANFSGVGWIVDAEILTVFNSFIYLRERLHTRPHLYAEELEFLSFAAKRCPLSCAQILQDLWVLYELKEKRSGYFVEFGACDGVTLSNTLLLEKTFGWQGALAEPARAWHDALRTNRSCYISSKCVYRTDGARILFRETDIRELSTLEELKHLDFHAPARDSGAQYEVETISLSNFLKEARAPKEIDYLSIDVEGAELDILKSFNFDEYNIKLITIEHNFADQRQEICDILERFGYRRKFMQLSMFDDWYVRPDLLLAGCE